MEPEKMAESGANLLEAINKIREPKGIKALKLEAQSKVLQKIVEKEGLDELTKLAIIDNYEKLIRAYVNKKNIISLAESIIEKEAKTADVDDDWFEFFFEKAEKISNEEAQQIWARILAEEISNPNTIPRSLIHALFVMDKNLAQQFCVICSYCLRTYQRDYIIPFIYYKHNMNSYSRLTYEGLKALEYLGLIYCDFEKEFVLPRKVILQYGNKQITIRGNSEDNNNIRTGNIQLTDQGRILYGMVGEEFKTYKSTFLDFLLDQLHSRKCSVYLNEKKMF